MTIFNDKVKDRQLINTYLAFMLNGMLALSIGSLLPFIRDARGLTYSYCGLIVSLHSAGNLIAAFIAGWLPIKIGERRSILLLQVFFALSYIIILFSGNLFLIAAAFFLTGIARGSASNYGNVKVNSLAVGKAWILNGLHAMFSIGAFVFPIVLSLITKNNADNWKFAVALLILCGVITWFLYLFIPESEVKADKKEKGKSDGSLGFFKEPMFFIVTLTLFFYLCAEQGVIGWMITYFKDTGLLNSTLSTITASIQWFSVLVGRLAVAYLSTKVAKEKMLPIMGVGLVAFFIVLIASTGPTAIIIGIVGFGLSMAGIYPTAVSCVGDLIQKYPLCWSFILPLASFGSIIMPSIIGRIAESSSIAAGMRTVAIAVVIDLVFIVILCRRKKYEDRKKSSMGL